MVQSETSMITNTVGKWQKLKAGQYKIGQNVTCGRSVFAIFMDITDTTYANSCAINFGSLVI